LEKIKKYLDRVKLKRVFCGGDVSCIKWENIEKEE